MKNIIDFLSGNVPGGIILYLVVLFVIVFVLYYLYRNSELFSATHFKWWFLGSWLIVTFIYAYLWVSNPSAALLKRYSVFVTASNADNEWLAKFYRDELSSAMKPYRNRDTYFFPQRWSYLAGVGLNEQKYEDICREVVIQQAVFGKIVKEKNVLKLDLALKEFPSGRIKNQIQVNINPEEPDAALSEALNWIGSFLPVKKGYHFQGVVDPTFIRARDEFFKRNYEAGDKLFKEALKRNPDNPTVKKWYNYNLIKLAATLRPDKERNPFETRKLPYEVMLSQARSFLKDLLRQNLEQNIEDDFLSNMLAESYLIEENYGEAEVFLKNAYVENRFNINVLENLTYLHASRYKDLGFEDEYQLYERIVNLCPIYADVLIKYIEKLLKVTPVHGVASARAKELIENFLSINPNSARSWLVLGEYYHANLNRKAAFQAYFKADSLEPRNASVQYNLGIMYYVDEDFDEAEKHFKKAIEFGNYLDAHLYLGSIYEKKGEYEKALERFRYRVAHKTGEDDYYAKEAMKGIRQCMQALNIQIPAEDQQ